jgi:hypothetical protein
VVVGAGGGGGAETGGVLEAPPDAGAEASCACATGAGAVAGALSVFSDTVCRRRCVRTGVAWGEAVERAAFRTCSAVGSYGWPALTYRISGPLSNAARQRKPEAAPPHTSSASWRPTA